MNAQSIEEHGNHFRLPDLAPEEESRHRFRSYLDVAIRQIQHMPAIGGIETLDEMRTTTAEIGKLIAVYVGSPDQVAALTVCAEQLGEQIEQFGREVPKLRTTYYLGPLRQSVTNVLSQLAAVPAKSAARKVGK